MQLAPNASELTSGTVIADSYQLVAAIGRGAMGTVWKARHLRLPREVAIKVMITLGDARSDADSYARFRREAEIVSRIGHPNIVEVLDFNNLPSGAPYIVMELLSGESLAGRLDRGPIPPAQVLALTQQIASALDAAHRQHVVHRDLKPDNIFLQAREGGDHVKVLDFGVSKIRGSQTVRTQNDVLIGTPQYMAPEQATGHNEQLDHRADIFALGAIVYEMLAGEPAFAGSSLAQVVYKVVHGATPSLALRMPWLPPSAVRAVETALDKDPARRFQDAKTFAAALGELARTPARTSSAGAGHPHPVQGTAIGGALPALLPAFPAPVPVPISSPGLEAGGSLAGVPEPVSSAPSGPAELPGALPFGSGGRATPARIQSPVAYQRTMAGAGSQESQVPTNHRVPERVAPRRRWPLVVGALLLVGAGAGITVLITGGGGGGSGTGDAVGNRPAADQGTPGPGPAPASGPATAPARAPTALPPTAVAPTLTLMGDAGPFTVLDAGTPVAAQVAVRAPTPPASVGAPVPPGRLPAGWVAHSWKAPSSAAPTLSASPSTPQPQPAAVAPVRPTRVAHAPVATPTPSAPAAPAGKPKYYIPGNVPGGLDFNEWNDAFVNKITANHQLGRCLDDLAPHVPKLKGIEASFTVHFDTLGVVTKVTLDMDFSIIQQSSFITWDEAMGDKVAGVAEQQKVAGCLARAIKGMNLPKMDGYETGGATMPVLYH